VAWSIVAPVCAIIAGSVVGAPWIVAWTIIERTRVIVARRIIDGARIIVSGPGTIGTITIGRIPIPVAIRWISIPISITVGWGRGGRSDQATEESPADQSRGDGTAAVMMMVPAVIAPASAAPVLARPPFRRCPP
jgi:hypothetical protein